MESEIKCLLCDRKDFSQQELLQHLLVQHSLVIGDLENIIDLNGYFDYWRKNFLTISEPLKHYCTTLTVGSEESQSSFFLLSDIIEEDKNIRKTLRENLLNDIIKKTAIRTRRNQL